MARRKKGHYDLDTEVESLMDFVYKNDLEQDLLQFSKYHFRLIGLKIIDIWPGTRKYYVHGMGTSLIYKDIEELKERLNR